MKKNQKKQIPMVFTMGELDLTLKIDFKDEELEIKEENSNKDDEKNESKENNKQKNYYNIEDFKALKDISFLDGNKKIISRFVVNSNNELLKLLLIGNKNSEKQSKIDYICYGYPKFEEEEVFFNEILDFVTEKNGINLNKNPLNQNGNYSINIEMTHKGKKQVISLNSGEKDEHEDDNEIKGEGQSSPNEENNEENNEDEYGDYEPNEMMKNGYIPKFRRKKSVLCNLSPSSLKYNLIYLNFEDLNKIPGNFKLEDMYELLEFFKKKKSTIFINYYKEEKENEEMEEKEKEEKEKKEKEKNEKGKNKKDKKEEKEGPSEEMIEINKFYYITDIYFFDKKQAIKIFNDHYKAFTEDKDEKSKKAINSKNVYDYFSKGIATGTEKEVPYDKTGLFLDEFSKYIIIRVSKNSMKKNEFDSQPYPKVNVHNSQEVNEYKKIIKENKNELYSLFLSDMIPSMCSSAPNCSSPEVLVSSFLTGVELVKRKVELKKNKIQMKDEENFYKIKKNSKKIAEQIEKMTKGQKEGDFKLDCTNLITSNKKEYVSLYDYHLKNYFSKSIVRKELVNKGFINDKGYIKYDPVYRNVMGSNLKNKKDINETEKKNRIITQIKDINIHNRLNDKEINCEEAAKNVKEVTDQKIPFRPEKKKEKIRKKKKKKEGVEGGSSSSGSSDEENNKSKEETNLNQ